MNIASLRVKPGSTFKLGKVAADDTHGQSKQSAAKTLPAHVEKLAELHDVLYAEHKHALLVVLQGMDASGKDGTIKHVMSGVNPQGCTVTSFKQPSVAELDHDFLWRVHAAVPPKGGIGIFNRSHYEDVLIARVHGLVPPAVWTKRYRQINDFEKMLAENNVHVIKFFLHVSHKEQRKRFAERLDDPRKNWKFSAADIKESEYWDDYQAAYHDAVMKCSTNAAPWYVIPSDHKWFRNYAVSEVIVQTLEALKMRYPERVPVSKRQEREGVRIGGNTRTG
jgi:PPK2 family polyphosphate:nucleotide phosphotransferase